MPVELRRWCGPQGDVAVVAAVSQSHGSNFSWPDLGLTTFGRALGEVSLLTSLEVGFSRGSFSADLYDFSQSKGTV